MRRAPLLLFVSSLSALCSILAGCGGTDSVGFLHDTDQTSVTTDASPPPSPDAGTSGQEPREPGPTGVPRDAGALPATDAGTTDRPIDEPLDPPREPPGPSSFCDPDVSTQPGCTGAAALARVFEHAICTCQGIQGTGLISTESLGADARAASIAVNGNMGLVIGQFAFPQQTAGRVDGDIIIADTAGSTVAGISGTMPFIRGDLRVAGPLLFLGSVHIGGDTWSEIMPLGLGRLQIDGDLFLSNASSTTQSPSVIEVGGAIQDAPRDIEPPCRCGAQAPINIASTVTVGAGQRDNAALGLPADGLAGVDGDRALQLPCGRYYLENVDVAGDLDLALTGRTALYVSGDFVIDGDVQVSMTPSASLDLFVTGNVEVSGSARFAPIERPTAARVYVGDRLALETYANSTEVANSDSAVGQTTTVGNFYAPEASLALIVNSHVYGSLFVRNINSLQGLALHHDAAVTTPEGCGGAP